MTFYDYFSDFIISFKNFFGVYAENFVFELLFGFLLSAIVFCMVGIPFILLRKLLDFVMGVDL